MGDQVERDRRLQAADEQVEHACALRIDLAQEQQAVDEQYGAYEHEPYGRHLILPPLSGGYRARPRVRR
jgi:hypothetical protein